jgi:hypothetical protein
VFRATVAALPAEERRERDPGAPGRGLVVETVLTQELLEWRVAGERARLRLWTNGHRGTDEDLVVQDRLRGFPERPLSARAA